MRPHDRCREVLRKGFIEAQRRASVELHTGPIEGQVLIATFRVVAPGFPEESYVCPHGTRYWIAPDAEMQTFLRALGP